MTTIAGCALLFAGYKAWTEGEEQATATASLPSVIAPPSLPSSSTESQVFAAAKAMPHAASVPMPAPIAAASPTIGSEGYGPHIERTHLSDDAKAAWQAVTWLQLCANNNTHEQHFQFVLDSATLPKEDAAAIAQQLQTTRAESRRCQTVVAQHRALLPPLALKAMRGNVTGAAAVYAGQINFSALEPAMQAELSSAIRADTGAGDAMTLLNTGLAGKAWGFNDEERLTYLAVYTSLAPGNLVTVEGLLRNGAITNIAPPTDAQKARVEAAAQKLIDGIKARRPPA